jgi:predicted Zn-dependent protease
MQERPQLLSALDLLRKGGALAAEVLLTRTEWLEQSGSRAPVSAGESVGWEVRAWKAGGATGTGSAPTLDGAVSQALQMMGSAAADPFAGPADRQDVRTAGLSTSDRRYASIEHADRVELLELCERAFEKSNAKSAGSVRLRDLHYRQERVHRSWASSRGADLSDSSTTFSLSGAAAFDDGRAIHQVLASRHFSDVASLPFGLDLRRRAEPLTRHLAGPIPDLPLLIEPRAMAEFARALAPAFAADHSGFIHRMITAGAPATRTYDPLRLAPPLLHMTDDAGLHSGLYTVVFDDRSVTPVPLALLREGVIGARCHSPETARADGTRATGHVRNGKIQPSNLVIRPGSRTRNMIRAELGEMLVLDAPPFLNLDTGTLEGPAQVLHVRDGETLGFYDVVFDIRLMEFFAGVVEFAADQERHIGVDTPTGVWDRLRATSRL